MSKEVLKDDTAPNRKAAYAADAAADARNKIRRKILEYGIKLLEKSGV